MSFFFDEVEIHDNGIITVNQIEVPRNGKIIKFLMTNGYLNKEVYIKIDEELLGPFMRPEAVECSIRGLERFRANLHEAYAIVIDTSEKHIEPMEIALGPRFLRFDSGLSDTAVIKASFEMIYRVGNAAALVHDFLNSGLNDIERQVKTKVEATVRKTVAELLTETINCVRDLCNIDALAEQAEEIICKRAEASLRWIDILQLKIIIKCDNITDLIKKQNIIFENNETLRIESIKKQMEMNVKAHSALLSAYESRNQAIPIAVKDLLICYMQMHPDADLKEVKSTAIALIELANKHSPDSLLKQAAKLGICKKEDDCVLY